MLFMSRSAPQFGRDAKGVPQLLLRTVHRLANHQTEAWTLMWSGEDAAEFYRLHANHLRAGQALSVSLHSLRTHTVGHLTEVQARVETCALLPRPQPQATPAAQATQEPA